MTLEKLLLIVWVVVCAIWLLQNFGAGNKK
jgi:hypothetical protein